MTKVNIQSGRLLDGAMVIVLPSIPQSITQDGASATPPIIYTSIPGVRLIVKGCSFYQKYRSYTAQNER
jgi:hypothetical protein